MNAVPHYSMLVYGGTMLGIGLALSVGEDVLVVEPSTMVGREFMSSFRVGEARVGTLKTETARQLRDELIERNLWKEGKFHIAPVAPVLFRIIRSHRLNVLMMTKIVEVMKGDDGLFEITLFNASGLRKVTADNIVDTTCTCQSIPGHPVRMSYKSLNAMLHSKPEEYIQISPIDGEIELEQGLLPGEMILKYKLEADDDWLTARAKLHRYWNKTAQRYAPWTMVLIADTFEIHPVPTDGPLEEGWSWLPSSGYSDLLQAFDEGCEKGSEKSEAVAES